MFYGHHLGINGEALSLIINEKIELLKNKYPKIYNIYELAQSLIQEYKNDFEFKAVYSYYNASVDVAKNEIFLRLRDVTSNASNTSITSIKWEGGLERLQELIPTETEEENNIFIFVATVGSKIFEKVAYLKENGDFLKSHILQSLALSFAEALAEALTKTLTKVMTEGGGRRDCVRLSPGYAKSFDLEVQRDIFELLDPEKNIGVSLSTNLVMSPVASVSAFVFSTCGPSIGGL
ncbi:MAG: hypothetical protein HQK51_14020 [Oligoflexia bacterium]|nr:hypothetical protein [Oligoflexia bacterium]